jgi:hypothetical protein
VIRTSESIVALSAAFVKAQAEMPGVPKETKGQVGSQVRFYADLATVVEVVRPILAKHGLAYVQLPTDTERNGHVAVTTRLVHESGEWMEDTLSMPAGQNGAQGVGSAITYCRRYSLMAVLGLAPEDDDGGAASQAPKQRPAPRRQESAPAAREPAPAAPEPAPDPNAMTEPQRKKLQALMNEKGYLERDRKLVLVGQVLGREVTTTAGLSKDDAGRIIDHLEQLEAVS